MTVRVRIATMIRIASRLEDLSNGKLILYDFEKSKEYNSVLNLERSS